MVMRFFLDFFGDYHGFSFFWDGRKYGVMATLLHVGLNCGKVLKLLPLNIPDEKREFLLPKRLSWVFLTEGVK